jgi:hypothetical protein
VTVPSVIPSVIADLALSGELLDQAKIGVLLVTLISVVAGVTVLLLASHARAVQLEDASIVEAPKI